MKMNFGEKIYHAGAGLVYGQDTDRLIANFSHSSEAESFVEYYNNKLGDL